jgi:hypothetical protein
MLFRAEAVRSIPSRDKYCAYTLCPVEVNASHGILFPVKRNAEHSVCRPGKTYAAC